MLTPLFFYNPPSTATSPLNTESTWTWCSAAYLLVQHPPLHCHGVSVTAGLTQLPLIVAEVVGPAWFGSAHMHDQHILIKEWWHFTSICRFSTSAGRLSFIHVSICLHVFYEKQSKGWAGREKDPSSTLEKITVNYILSSGEFKSAVTVSFLFYWLVAQILFGQDQASSSNEDNWPQKILFLSIYMSTFWLMPPYFFDNLNQHFNHNEMCSWFQKIKNHQSRHREKYTFSILSHLISGELRLRPSFRDYPPSCDD